MDVFHIAKQHLTAAQERKKKRKHEAVLYIQEASDRFVWYKIIFEKSVHIQFSKRYLQI